MVDGGSARSVDLKGEGEGQRAACSPSTAQFRASLIAQEVYRGGE